MVLGTYTIANPVQIERSTFYLSAANLAYAGTHYHYFFHALTPGKVLRVHQIKITWNGLGQSEYNDVRAAHLQTLFGYVLMSVPGLGIHTLGPDMGNVTADFRQAGLSAESAMGWKVPAEAGPPVVYDVVGVYISAVEDADPPA